MMNTDWRSEEKWGEAARGGFQIVPDILFKRQVALGLTATEMMVLLNITSHWWYAEQRPFPRASTIATRMGVDQRTVQRALKRLDELGMVHRVVEQGKDGRERIVCDLSGLVAKLEQFVRTDSDYLIRQRGRIDKKALAEQL